MSTTILANKPGRSGEDLAEIREKIRAADEEARDNWFDNDWRREMLRDMVEVIMLGWEHENLVELLAEVEEADEFERITIEEARGVEVFWVSAGGQIDQTRITSRVWELVRNYCGFHVAEFEDKIRSGFSKFQGNLVSAAIMQMDAAVNSRLLRTYQAAIPGPSSPYYVSGPGFTLAQLNTAITEVIDEGSETGDESVTIVGRATMVDQIMNQLQANNNFVPETNEEIIRQGRLGTYRGANLVRLRNFRDRNKKSYFPANELFVVNTSAAKVGFWNPIKAKEWTEEGGEYWHSWAKRQAGFAVWRPARARRFVDTSSLP